MTLDFKGTKGTLIFGAIVIGCFAAGLLIGHLVTPSSSEGPNQEKVVAPKQEEVVATEVHVDNTYTNLKLDKWEEHKDGTFLKDVIASVNPENIRNNLKYISEKPHLAASPRDVELANYLRDKFDEAGFDEAKLVPYNLFLMKPDPNNPNKITMTQNGEKIFVSNHKEKAIHPDDEDPDFVHAFNAFTPAGTVTTEPGVGVVYVNYGRIEDFEMLEELGVNMTGHVALVRYGKIYRGNKIRHAEQHGAVGVIIFSDPEDVAPEGITAQDVYDNSWWLPGSGMQRGSTYLGDGDPLTPGWPSTEHAYRITEEEADLHNIPAQPIGYDDAMEILKRLGGDPAPDDWQGGLPGLTYRLGPFFNDENSNVSLTLSTHNQGKVESSYNVIGIIRGSIEPDRYVLVGNHRDAWGYGAADPSSGTAQLVETVRVFGTLLQKGWRPRRSLVFCSWGAEEFGLIGSTEWVEENVVKLQSRAVAYINTDTCASGPKLQIRASPLLQDLFNDITKMIPGVEDPSKTLFDEWDSYYKEKQISKPDSKMVKGLGSGSDYASFSIYGGIPAADIWFRRDGIKHNISMYPFYHTGYETFYMVSTFVDPEFKIHQGCGRLALLSLLYLADSAIIPYNIKMFPETMLTNLENSKHKEKFMEIYNKFDELLNSVRRFKTAAEEFDAKIKQGQSRSEIQIRTLNDQMMRLEQMFIIPEGLPGRPTVRNAVFAPSLFDNYSSDGFPGLNDLLHKIDQLEPEERMEREKQIKRHISDLTIMTDRATSFLQEAYQI